MVHDDAQVGGWRIGWRFVLQPMCHAALRIWLTTLRVLWHALRERNPLAAAPAHGLPRNDTACAAGAGAEKCVGTVMRHRVARVSPHACGTRREATRGCTQGGLCWLERMTENHPCVRPCGPTEGARPAVARSRGSACVPGWMSSSVRWHMMLANACRNYSKARLMRC